jgi:hypothetical protein
MNTPLHTACLVEVSMNKTTLIGAILAVGAIWYFSALGSAFRNYDKKREKSLKETFKILR